MERDGKSRLCIDYRKLNAATKVDVYPIPRIDELIHGLEGYPILSLFDLKSGFWQIRVNPDDVEKTAFTAGNHTYAFKYMPFGLNNAPSTFQRFVNRVFNGFINEFVNIYIDDIIVYSKTFEDHIKHLRKVFERLDEYQLRLHPEKCSFLCKEVKFLGFIIGPKGILPDPKRAEAIEKFPPPNRVKCVRAFLGMCGYYRKYILNFAGIANPLTNLLRKNIAFKWDEECQQAFQTLKDRLMNPPILAHYKVGEPLKLYTDTSRIGLVAILCQIQDGIERTIKTYTCWRIGKVFLKYDTYTTL